MPKRKANVENGGEAEPLRRSTRQKSSAAVKQEGDTKPAAVRPKKTAQKAEATDVGSPPHNSLSDL